MQSTGPLPVTQFDSDYLDPADRFSAWRESVMPLFDVALPDRQSGSPFKSQAEMYQLDDIVAGTVFTQAQRFRQAHISERTDHILIQLHLSGGYRGDMDGDNVHVMPGCVSLIDLSRPLKTTASDTHIANVVLPREHFDTHPDFLNNLHGMVLSPGRGAFLAEYLKALMGRLPHLSQCEAPDVAGVTRDMILSCAYWDAQAQERIGPDLKTVAKQRIQQIVEQHLTAPTLTPDWLCRTAGVSRANLYRLFRNEGGVVRYIQYRRMAAIRRSLEDPREYRSIHELALRYGFDSPPHFSRRFKQLYGMSPRDWRHIAHHQAQLGMSADTPSLSRWARQLGR
ncbi:helix-turn-helix domain-containing protein [Aidingimonas lacisalsi]|uniref:helix-turn-helix domain-containing protein n=1 Tax=Aidingimonas lacisalsi TaxID=2604086 RepID=UPI0011D28914|nr:helix-turn-helix domain-containing protein [Aidingimonas lacisalsi]